MVTVFYTKYGYKAPETFKKVKDAIKFAESEQTGCAIFKRKKNITRMVGVWDLKKGYEKR